LYAVSRKKPIIAAASVFFALLVGIAGLRYYQYRAENRAFSLLQQAAAAATADGKSGRQAASGAFERLFESYPDKAASHIGKVIYAGICYRAGEAEKAADLYSSALPYFDGDPALQSLIQSGLGFAREAKGDLSKAAATFRRISEMPEAVFKDNALFQLARISEKLGSPADGASLYGRITEDYPSSMFGQIAREKAERAAGG
jgi:tetratricopeptide (TPR) repeat protein